MRLNESHLNPPEDTRKEVYSCAICDEPIREGDEYYDIPDYGKCCTDCMNNCHHYDAELDYPED